MKTRVLNLAKIGLILVGALLGNSFVRAAGTYTAVASGNWSSSITWGGTPPPFTLTAGDQVNVATGITVNMDSTVTVNGLLAQINVTGTLTSASSTFLNVTTGTLTGSGVINVGNVVLNAGSTFSFTGNLTAQTMSNAIVSLTSTANITVNQALSLMSILTVQTGGTLSMAANSVVTIAGGQLDLSGGTLNLSSTYDVDYTSASTTTGMELSGSGLRNVIINVGAGNSVALGGNLTTNDSLRFVSGTLVLNGNALTINGKVGGTTSITGDASADIAVTTAGGIAVPLSFTSGGQMLNDLTVNIGSGSSLFLGSDLSVEGALALTGGSDLSIHGISLTLDGTLSGSGMLDVNSASAIIINTAGSITAPIVLSGTSIGNFTVNVGSGNTVTLGSSLAVAGTLNLQSGTLVLNSNSVSVSGDIAASGSGNLFSTASSNVTISTAASPSGTLAFSYPGNIVKNFNVNIGGAGTVTMASNVVIQGTLNFTSGYLSTGSNDVQIASGGSIMGTNTNSYIVTAANGTLTMNATTSAAANFPIGTASYYFPASISLNSGSSTGTVSANVSQGVYQFGTSGTQISATQPMVNATWLFETSISSGLNYNMVLSWSPAAEVNGFIRTNDYISHYTSSNWDMNTFASASASGSGLFSIGRNNLTSMSPFAVFDSSTSPAGINELADNAAFQMYPNPASENLYVKTGSVQGELVYADILNICGQVVSTSRLDNATITSIPVKALANGIYFLRLYNDKMNVIQKFVKAE